MRQMFGMKTRTSRRSGFIQLDTRDYAPACSEEIERHGDHGIRLNLEHRVKQLALARVFPDFVLEKRLLAGEDHANKPGAQRLLELADQPLRLRSRIPGGDKKFTGLIGQPDSSLICAGFDETACDRLSHERVEEGRELFRPDRFCDAFEPLGED